MGKAACLQRRKAYGGGKTGAQAVKQCESIVMAARGKNIDSDPPAARAGCRAERVGARGLPPRPVNLYNDINTLLDVTKAKVFSSGASEVSNHVGFSVFIMKTNLQREIGSFQLAMCT